MESWKVQLEILNEAEQKSDGKTPVIFDELDAVRMHNFKFLVRKKCFEWTGKGVKCLSKIGQLYRAELLSELEDEQRKDEEIELLRRKTVAAEEEVRKAEDANSIAREALAEAKKANESALDAIKTAQRANLWSAFAVLAALFCAVISRWDSIIAFWWS